MKFVAVVVAALVSVAHSRPSADAEPQQARIQENLSSFAEQFAKNQAAVGAAGAAGSVPGRFSYQVNSVHPVPKPTLKNFGVPASDNEEKDFPAQAIQPAIPAVPAVQAVPAYEPVAPLYNGYTGYTPYAAYPWATSPYYNFVNNYLPSPYSDLAGSYLSSPYSDLAGSYLSSPYNYLPPLSYTPFGLGLSGPNAEE